MADSSFVTRLRQNKAARALLAPLINVRRAHLRRKFEVRHGLIENLRQVLAEDPICNVAEFEGVFRVDHRSDLFARLASDGRYEPDLVGLVRKLVDPERDVVDIGANIGFYAVLFAKLLGGDRRVLAVEPTSNALSHLRWNIDRNGVSERVVVFPGVASSEAGSLEISTVPGREEYSSLGAMAHPSIGASEIRTETVEARTADELVAEHALDPGFLKVDVEGAEHLVFAGAGAFLKKHQPVILSELSDDLLRKNRSSSRAVIELIEAAGYHVIDPVDPDIAPGHKAFGDILCMPENRMSRSEFIDSTRSTLRPSG